MRTVVACFMVFATSRGAIPACDAPAPARSEREALKPFADLAGDWKGTGQPIRGSARNAWRESIRWVWSIQRQDAALVGEVAGGRYVRRLTIKPAPGPGRYLLELVQSDGSIHQFHGKAESTPNRWSFERACPADSSDRVQPPITRITMSLPHASRQVLLLQTQATPEAGPERLAEIGYTREGVPFAQGDAYPECIVTGGRGTIAVSHKGQTYHVCCSGCKEAFEADPESFLSDRGKPK
jgi:YHS domain-containing protein